MTHGARGWVQRLSLRHWGLLALCLLADLGIALAIWSVSNPDVALAFNNTLVTPTWIMKEGLFRLNNSLRFSRNVTRTYDKQYRVDGAKVGYIVNARLPVQYLVRDGAQFQGQDIEEKIVPIEITDQTHIAIEFGSSSLTMQVDDYNERYLQPAFDQLAADLDKRGMARMAKATSEFVGTPGVPPGSSGTNPEAATGPYLDAGVILDEAACPVDMRKAFLPPKFHRYLVSGQQANIFYPAQQLSQNYRRGQFSGEALGVEEWYKTQSTYRHTVGALGGTPLVNGAAQSGASIITDGWTAVAATRLLEGDKITFASSKAVNPQTRQTTGTLKVFTLTENGASDGSGNMTIKISPAIIGPGSPYQNVSALPADNDVIKIFGHASSYASTETQMGLICNKNAYALVSADLEKMEGAWVCERIRSKAVGIAFRFWKDRDIRSDSAPCRVDDLYGWKAVRENLAIVVVG